MSATSSLDDRFDCNLRALQRHLDPSAIQFLSEHRNKHVQIGVSQQGEFENLRVDGAPLYQPDGPTYISERIADFARNPQQIRFADKVETPKRFENLASVAASIVNDFAQSRFQYKDPDFGAVGALVSLGLGAGIHLPELTDKVDFTDLIIVEPELEFFIASLRVCDWAKVVSRLEEKGGALSLIFDQDPALVYEGVLGAMRGRSFALIEGSCFFIHDTRPTMIQLLQRIGEAGLNIVSYNGWLEDELRHACNHAINVSGRDFSVLLGARAGEQQTPRDGRIFVVTGSGPSLGENIDLLIELREKIVLVSAGTSLRPLLKAGLRPDFHCELENVDAVPYLLGALGKEYGLGGITLVASTTVDPRVPALFEKTIFFVREGDGVMPALKGPVEQIQFVGPSSVNTGTVLSDWLGASGIVLVGADFGKPDDTDAYTDGVVYGAMDKVNRDRVRNGLHPLAKAGSTRGDMRIAVAGNADAAVFSNNVLIMMRHRLEVTLGTLQARVFNLGRGARIAGADPITREEIEPLLSSRSRNGDGVGTGAPASADRVRTYSSDDFRAAELLAQFADRMNVTVDTCLEALKRLAADMENCRLEDIHDALLPLLDARPGLQRGEDAATRAVRVALSGSVLRIFHVIRHVCVRLFNEDRPVFFRYAVDFLADFLPVMKAEAAENLNMAADAAVCDGKVPETPLGQLLRLRTAEQPIDRNLLENALFPAQGATSLYLAQYILCHPSVVSIAIRNSWLIVDRWFLDLMYRTAESKHFYSFFVRRAFSFLCLAEDESIDPLWLGIFEREAAMVRGSEKPWVNDAVSQFYLLSGDAERGLAYAREMTPYITREERCAITMGNALLAQGAINDALKAFAEADGIKRKVGPEVELDLYGAALWLSGEKGRAWDYYMTGPGRSTMGRIVFSALEPGKLEQPFEPDSKDTPVFVRRAMRLLRTVEKSVLG